MQDSARIRLFVCLAISVHLAANASEWNEELLPSAGVFLCELIHMIRSKMIRTRVAGSLPLCRMKK